jgi:fatty acid desaturase
MLKPDIPREFRAISNGMGLYYIVHGLMLWFAGAAAAHSLWMAQSLPLALRVLGAVPLVVLSGFGMFFLALQGHEGFHGNLHRHRDVSMLMGIAASSTAPMFLSVGYNVIHWQHHLHTNTARDPDYQLYRRHKTFLARWLNGPRETVLNCLRNTATLVFAPERLERSFPFSAAKARIFALTNLLLALASLAAYAAVAVLAPHAVFVFFVALPLVVSQTYWALCPYIEHAGTAVGDGVDTRTVTSSVLRVLLLGYNYHLCHHLYPRVQLHRLPALYRHLAATHALPAGNVVEGSLVRALRIGATAPLEF